MSMSNEWTHVGDVARQNCSRLPYCAEFVVRVAVHFVWLYLASPRVVCLKYRGSSCMPSVLRSRQKERKGFAAAQRLAASTTASLVARGVRARVVGACSLAIPTSLKIQSFLYMLFGVSPEHNLRSTRNTSSICRELPHFLSQE